MHGGRKKRVYHIKMHIPCVHTYVLALGVQVVEEGLRTYYVRVAVVGALSVVKCSHIALIELALI